jgi:hypothetical protein
MATLYRYYKVIGFSYKITAVHYQADTATVLCVRPVPVNENSTISGSNLAQQLERPGSRVVYNILGAGRPNSISGKVDIPRLLGVTKEQFDADVSQYGATTTTQPSRYPYLQVAIAGNTTSTPFSHVVVECVYTVQFWQRITQDQSTI